MAGLDRELCSLRFTPAVLTGKFGQLTLRMVDRRLGE
jgi:hypothetical protein